MIVDIICIYSIYKIIINTKKHDRVYFVIQNNGFLDRIGIKILHLLRRELVPIEYELKPDGENNYYFKIHKQLDKFFKEWVRPGLVDEVENNRYFSEYERKRLLKHFELLSKRRTYRSIEILHIANMDKFATANLKSVLLMDTVCRKGIAYMYKQQGLDAIFYNIFKINPFKLGVRNGYYMDLVVKETFEKKTSQLYRSVVAIYRIIKEIFKSFKFRILRYFDRSLPEELGIFDVVSPCPGYERNEGFNDLFWKDRMSDSPTVLAILYGKMDKDAYEKYGHLAKKWITFDRPIHSPEILSAYYWFWPLYPKILISNIKDLIRSFIETKSSCDHWFEIVNVWIELSKMKALFILTKAKLYWTNIEGVNISGLGSALAINQLNGVSLGSTWSVYGFLNFITNKNKIDCYFVWGEDHAEIIKKDELCGSLIISGYPGDFYMKNTLKESVSFREECIGKYNPKSIFCYYDNLATNDIQNNYSVTVKYLRNILNWIDKNKGTILIIKTKRKSINNAYPEDIKELLVSLEKEGRIVYKFGKGDLSSGFASDMVLGIGLATLPLICGTHGKGSVILDSQRVYKEASINIDGVKFIEDPDLVLQYMDECLQNRETTINNVAKPNNLVSFVDGKTSERISEYIGSLMADLNNGLSRNDAIKNANQKYRQEWGDDKVIEMSMNEQKK